MIKKSIFPVFALISIIYSLILFSCGKSPLKSISNQDSLSFIHSVYNEQIVFGGTVAFENSTGHDIVDIKIKEATLKIEYKDGSKDELDMMVLGKTTWLKDQVNRIKFAIDPFKNHPYIDLDNFKRTPKSATLKSTLTIITTNDEKEFNYEVDVTSKWSDFQKANGIQTSDAIPLY
ncbi:hypothetical protein J3L18_23675 [Mucilaginibacter gossypii]|uniref:hypothetical protein n=1 Tax=Mucilaginibacter gossypii TaxID=551996 RepID=UPI000DCD31B2|nr:MULTISPECIES: hypothetical protein [Mucilaginibacter]QTE36105.1 hypothetical protein J3L18_23675 [Mucilaginibacter gossypii]RAV59982.1 hypothetical protein DIU36_03140 [Mucilaginibacter rubeus]